jgi:predicted nucleic acid-binding protein
VITAVDTNVLIDVLRGDPKYGPMSSHALQHCIDEGGLVVSDVVWSEMAATFQDPAAVAARLRTLGASFTATSEKSATAAGVAWRAYRLAGGPRTRVAADFMIGAHAMVQADRLLTRDRGFFRSYFADLVVVDPTT